MLCEVVLRWLLPLLLLLLLLLPLFLLLCCCSMLPSRDVGDDLDASSRTQDRFMLFYSPISLRS